MGKTTSPSSSSARVILSQESIYYYYVKNLHWDWFWSNYGLKIVGSNQKAEKNTNILQFSIPISKNPWKYPRESPTPTRHSSMLTNANGDDQFIYSREHFEINDYSKLNMC